MRRTIPRWRAEAVPLIWVCGAALTLTLLMTLGMVVLILVNGVGYFWPDPVYRVQLKDGTILFGEIWDREAAPGDAAPSRLLLAHGARDLYGTGYRWVDTSEITRIETFPDAVRVERTQWGPVFGVPRRVREADRVILQVLHPDDPLLLHQLEVAAHTRHILRRIEARIERVNDEMERLRRRILRIQYRSGADSRSAVRIAALEQRRQELQKDYARLHDELKRQREQALRVRLEVWTGSQGPLEIPLVEILHWIPANRMNRWAKLRVYLARWWELLSQKPREANTEGGIYPALMGTVAMVLIMTLLVVPLGVVAALYLREYARQNWWTRMIRISVNNLAGVPSIVYGVFGVGFFIYYVGGWIDRTFFPELLPTPTFGTGGLLWASMTLALLTVPVVIVATEEALLAIPPEIRHGARALGATQWQTIRHLLIPAALPGILTGMILAIARATGEVAPLMLTGVVKLAPDLPIDGQPPFLHLERKFMHLGFHIYDVGFQSPDVEAAKPMVYNTTLLLLAVVIVLNLGALWLRNRIRRQLTREHF